MSHYFETPTGDIERTAQYRITVGDRTATIVTGAGVFSSRRLDPGTGHLIDHLVAHSAALESSLGPGAIVDVGCGAGPLTVALGLLFPERAIVGVDVNVRAVDLAAANASRAGLANVTICTAAPDNVDPRACIGDIPVAAVVSNPPVRIGKSEMRRMLSAWLSMLAPGGRMLLVVSRHLGADSLAEWLGSTGANVVRLASKSGYRILSVTVS